MARRSSVRLAFPPFTYAVKWLVIINCAIYVLMLVASGLNIFSPTDVYVRLGIVPLLVVQHGWVWQLVTYAFIHGDITHLGMNSVWFLPFGSAVARRFGNLRVIGFFGATAAAGALTHLVTHWGELTPMIGASAAVSGFMAGSIRFAFQRGGPLAMFRSEEPAAYLVPAAPLSSALRDPRIMVFLLAWFGLNLLFGIGSIGLPGGEQSIAWEAHIGGFLAGLLLFPLFDPVPAGT